MNQPITPLRRIAVAIATAMSLSSLTLAAPPELPLEPTLNKKGRLLFSGFKKGEGESGLGKHWKIGHGKWILDGDLVTTVKAKDADHSCGLRSHVGLLPDRLILEYRFRFNSDDSNAGAHKMNVRFMGKGKALVFHPTSKSVSARTQLADGGTKLLFEDNEVRFKNDRWYTVGLEIRDDRCSIQIEGIGSYQGKHEQIHKRKKPFFAFNIGKASASIKDVKLWADESVGSN